MRKIVFKSVLAAFFIAATATLNVQAVCAGSGDVFATIPATAHSSEKIYNLPGLSNVGRVAPGVLRGAQPGKDGYATLKAMGVRTVIDMRTTVSEQK